MSKVIPVSNVFQRLTDLNNKKTISTIAGHYDSYKEASIKYAELAVDNFETVKKLTSVQYNFPIFSDTTLNVLKIKFLDMFRKKTPAEKQLKKLGEAEIVRRKIFDRIV